MWIVDAETLVFVEANQAALDLYGYTREQFLGMSFFEVSRPEQTSLLLRGTHENSAEPDPAGRVFEHIEAKGRSIKVEVVTRAAEIAGRKVLLGVSAEIPGKLARKRIFEHIRDVENLIRTFLDAEPQFVTQLDRESNVLNINHAGLKLIDSSYGDVLGKSFRRFILPPYQAAFSSLVGRIFDGNSVTLQFEILGSGGAPRLLDMNAVPIRNEEGEVTSLLAISRDITERRRAQDRLMESERRFKTVFDEAPIGMCLVSPKGHLLQVNRAYAKLLGYQEDELVGKHYLELTHQKDMEMGAEILSRFVSGAVNVFELEKSYLHKQGHEVNVSIKGCAIRNPVGELEYILAQVQDTTEWKRAEKAMRDQQMMSALGALVASVAHEVRNPLFGISAVLDAFEARHAEDASLKKYFLAMRTELGRMNDLMRELLDYGKPVLLELEPVSVLDVLREALTACLPLAKMREISLRTDLRQAPPATHFDRRRLYLVFRNLIENAIHYSPARGTVIVEVAEVRDQQGRWIALNFKDSGPGFATADLPRIFEPFFSRRKGGTGLGLAIVKRIVDEHRGSVVAANREDGGAIVTLKLPENLAQESSGQLIRSAAGGA